MYWQDTGCPHPEGLQAEGKGRIITSSNYITEFHEGHRREQCTWRTPVVALATLITVRMALPFGPSPEPRLQEVGNVEVVLRALANSPGGVGWGNAQGESWE